MALIRRALTFIGLAVVIAGVLVGIWAVVAISTDRPVTYASIEDHFKYGSIGSEPGGSLDFLGYTFRYDRDLHGRPWRYLNLCPSKKSLRRERDKLREMTGPGQCFKPIPLLIAQVNEHLRGWCTYFGRGYPRDAFRRIDRFARERLERHLKRRSQRPFRVRGTTSWYEQLIRLGWQPL
jgi:hypothetical protein